jgi:aromatic amino acid aminotransferase I / 2-aminoadipate transaminase
MSAERKKAIYAVCVKYGMIYALFLKCSFKTCNGVDIIIVEDDPYYFLQMPEYAPPNNRSATSGESRPELDGEEFIESLAPSYLK